MIGITTTWHLVESLAPVYVFCVVIALTIAAKRENTIATIFLFLSAICCWPLVYFGKRGDLWTTYFKNFDFNNFKIPGIGFIFFLLGLYFLIFIKCKKRNQSDWYSEDF